MNWSRETASPANTSIWPNVFQYWPTANGAGPTLKQHWVKSSCLLSRSILWFHVKMGARQREQSVIICRGIHTLLPSEGGHTNTELLGIQQNLSFSWDGDRFITFGSYSNLSLRNVIQSILDLGTNSTKLNGLWSCTHVLWGQGTRYWSHDPMHMHGVIKSS